MGSMRKVSNLEENKKSIEKKLALPMQKYKEDMSQEVKNIKELYNIKQLVTYDRL